MARAICSSAPLAERRLSSEHAGWAEGSCVTSQRFHGAVLRVFVFPSWGPSSLSSRGSSLCAFKARRIELEDQNTEEGTNQQYSCTFGRAS
jgi:hypothetical protein